MRFNQQLNHKQHMIEETIECDDKDAMIIMNHMRQLNTAVRTGWQQHHNGRLTD
ncbi:MAG: hypothetical protein OEY29_15295 [Gammaproteobacteria bacterium]|nr:hypothetical protein [Gammaproteobacteria bacterium]